ncbi:4Fe-4S ferredoxin, partial [Desulfobacteraceae bacterium SEEP-SAG10]
LYAGTRSDSPHHLLTAIQNGFAYAVVDAPIIIADGLRGKSETAVTINQKNFKKVYIGSDIMEADALISVAHFKGHELSGFGGTIKNVGMGCASRRGKLAQHSTVAPKVIKEKCVGCGDCTDHCSQNALSLKKEKAVLNAKK